MDPTGSGIPLGCLPDPKTFKKIQKTMVLKGVQGPRPWGSKEQVCSVKEAIPCKSNCSFSEFEKWSNFQILGLRSEDIGVRWKMVGSPSDNSI